MINNKTQLTNNVPRIGIGVLVMFQNKILLLKRKSSHGTDMWCLGGGHLEFGETIIECAKREVKEETGLIIKNAKIICVNEDLYFIQSDNKHYITIGCLAHAKSKKFQNKEPDKHSELNWFDLNDLPQPLFPPSKNIVECYKKGTICIK